MHELPSSVVLLVKAFIICAMQKQPYPAIQELKIKTDKGLHYYVIRPYSKTLQQVQQLFCPTS